MYVVSREQRASVHTLLNVLLTKIVTTISAQRLGGSVVRLGRKVIVLMIDYIFRCFFFLQII